MTVLGDRKFTGERVENTALQREFNCIGAVKGPIDVGLGSPGPEVAGRREGGIGGRGKGRRFLGDPRFEVAELLPFDLQRHGVKSDDAARLYFLYSRILGFWPHADSQLRHRRRRRWPPELAGSHWERNSATRVLVLSAKRILAASKSRGECEHQPDLCAGRDQSDIIRCD